MTTELIIVGGCRIPVSNDIQANKEEIKKAIDWAANEHVELFSTPECSLSGYMWKPDSQDDPRIEELDLALQEVMAYSKEKAVDLVLGTAWFDEKDQWRNTQAFIVDGECRQVHYKNLLYHQEKEIYIAGTEVGWTNYKGFRVAGMICNDYWSHPQAFPGESAKMLNYLKDNQMDIVFLSAFMPQMDAMQEFIYNFNEASISLISAYSFFDTVVSDVANGYKNTACGMVDGDNGKWIIRAKDTETDYFKDVLCKRVHIKRY